VIDLLASTTQDPILSNYSDYIEDLHGPEGYYIGVI